MQDKKLLHFLLFGVSLLKNLMEGGWDRPVTHPGAKWRSPMLTRPLWFPVVRPADLTWGPNLAEAS